MSLFDKTKYFELKHVSHLYESTLNKYMNATSRPYIEGEVHVSHSTTCPRKVVADILYEIPYENLDDYLALWVGKCFHEHLRFVLPAYTPERTYREVINVPITNQLQERLGLEGIDTLPVTLVGSIDFTKRGPKAEENTIEAKSVNNFVSLSRKLNILPAATRQALTKEQVEIFNKTTLTQFDQPVLLTEQQWTLYNELVNRGEILDEEIKKLQVELQKIEIPKKREIFNKKIQERNTLNDQKEILMATFPYEWSKTGGKIPTPTHIDQSNFYLSLSGRKGFITLYFSKKQREGLHGYSVTYDLRIDDHEKIYEENKNLLFKRAGFIGIALEVLKKYDKMKDIHVVSSVINEVTKSVVDPSGLCAWCQFGGYKSARFDKGRKKLVTPAEKFFFNNGCDIPIKERTGYKDLLTKIPVTSSHFNVPHRFLNQTRRNFVKYTTSKILRPYQGLHNLVEICNRKRFYGNLPTAEKAHIINSSIESQSEAIWYWVWHTIAGQFLKSLAKQGIPIKPKQHELISKSGNIKYTFTIPLIDDTPSIIIPVVAYYRDDLPYSSHKEEGLLLQSFYPDPKHNIQLVYFPIRQQAYPKGPPPYTYLRTFQLATLDQEIIDLNRIIVEKGLDQISYNSYQVGKHCNWCWVRSCRYVNKEKYPTGNPYQKDPLPTIEGMFPESIARLACPEGFKSVFERNLSTVRSEKMKKTRVSMVRDQPFDDEDEDYYEDDDSLDLDDIIWLYDV